jgi:hypothetical protein
VVHVGAEAVEERLSELPEFEVLRQAVEQHGKVQHQELETAINRVGDRIFAVKAGQFACATIMPYRVEMVSGRVRRNRGNIIGSVRRLRLVALRQCAGRCQIDWGFVAFGVESRAS